MTKARWFCVALAGIFVSASVAWAAPADGGAQERPGRQRQRERRRAGGVRLGTLDFQTVVKELALTEPQQAQVKQILETHAQDVRNWAGEHGEAYKKLREQMTTARKDKDEKAFKELREKSAALGRQRAELVRRMHTQLEEVLTDEQKAKLRVMVQRDRRRGPPLAVFRRALAQLGLTDAQKQQAEKIVKAAMADAKKAEKPQDRAEIITKAIDSVRNTVLTPEQRQKLAALRPADRTRQVVGRLAELNLSDEQQQQVRKLLAEARVKAGQAEPQQRRQAMRAAWDNIINTVLTEAQREKLKQLREQREKNPPEGGRVRPGGRPEGP